MFGVGHNVICPVFFFTFTSGDKRMSTEIKAGDWVKFVDTDGIGEFLKRHLEYSKDRIYKVRDASEIDDSCRFEGYPNSFYKFRFSVVPEPQGFEVGDEVMLKPDHNRTGFHHWEVYKVIDTHVDYTRTLILLKSGSSDKLSWEESKIFDLISAQRKGKTEDPWCIDVGDIVVIRPSVDASSERILSITLTKGTPYEVIRTNGEWLTLRDDKGCLNDYGRMQFVQIEPDDPVVKPALDLDFTKSITTREGLKVEIVSIKGRGELPVLYYVQNSNLLEFTSLNGRKYGDVTPRKEDLINVPN